MGAWGCLFELFFEPLVWLVFYVLLLPVSLVLMTPFILIRAPFGPCNYAANVKNGYADVLAWWGRVGEGLRWLP